VTPQEHIAAFGTADGELRVGGMPLTRLAARVGSTPFFAYDRGLLDQRVELLRSTLPERMEISFAMKANPMPAVVQHLAHKIDRIDVASGLELHTALNTGIRADKVSFAGPGKSPAEIRQAVAAGILVEIESATEFGRVITAGDELGVTPSVAMRVNPDFAVKGSGMRMGGGPQQFGIDSEQVPAVLREYATAGVNVLGFHVFAGSQNLNAAIIAEAQRRTVDLVSDLAEHLPTPMRYLNLGGGFGIPYVEADRPLDLEAVAGNLRDLVDGPIARRMPEASPVIELGRFIVGECGVYVTRVIDRKVSRGKTFLIVDGGMHHQLAASGNFGQAIRRNYPVAVGTQAELACHDGDDLDGHDGHGGTTLERATGVGCLCTPLDLLGDDIALPPAEIDDLIVIFQAGAYGLTASPTAFLGHPLPLEVLV
jgi:diaminopimelate decarboxylase